MHYSQPLPPIINIPVGGKALLRTRDLDVSEYQTLFVGVPMKSGLQRQAAAGSSRDNNKFYTNSITLGGGESLDVILDATATSHRFGAALSAGSGFYLFTPNSITSRTMRRISAD